MKTKSEIHDTAGVAGEAAAPVAPEKPGAKNTGGRKKAARKGAKTAARAKSSKSEKLGKKGKNAPQREGKGATILEMIGRTKGATLAEIMTTIGWQAHSVRGFISTAGKKPGIRIESTKNDSGGRVYRLVQ